MIAAAELERIRQEHSLAGVVARYVNLKRAGREYRGLCPFHREKTPSFGVVEAKRFFHCFGCGAHGDLFSFLMMIEGLSFQDAVARFAPGATLPASSPIALPPLQDISDDRRVKQAERVWDGTQPLAGSAAERYLREDRAIAIDLPATLAYHPALEYWQDAEDENDPPVLLGRFPALVAMVETVAGDFCGVWRIYLADVPIRKRGLGCVSGGAVRLGPPADELGIGEGLESTLSAAELGGGLLPFWSALSTSGIRMLQLPPEVRHPCIFADRDQAQRDQQGRYRRHADGALVCAGEDAARAACARWLAEGRTPSFHLPPLKDFNIVLRARKGLILAEDA